MLSAYPPYTQEIKRRSDVNIISQPHNELPKSYHGDLLIHAQGYNLKCNGETRQNSNKANESDGA